jgi:hypothetical protein
VRSGKENVMLPLVGATELRLSAVTLRLNEFPRFTLAGRAGLGSNLLGSGICVDGMIWVTAP